MDPVREVNGHRAYRQIDDIAPGGKHKDFIRKDVHLYCIDKVFGIAHVIVPFQQLAQP